MADTGQQKRKGRAPVDGPYIWFQLANKGLRVAFNQRSFETLGSPERVLIEIQAEGICFSATDYTDVGYKLCHNNASWIEVCSVPLLRKWLDCQMSFPFAHWLLAELRGTCLFLSVNKKMDCNALAGSQSGSGSPPLLSTDSSDFFKNP